MTTTEKSRILVVDDNEQFCQNVTDILELMGYEVMTAPDGFKALDAVKQERFDLVLMDIKMPAMDGVETFKKVKGVAPNTPVIMVTAYAMEDLIKEALREGAYGSLKKPLDFDHLLKLIAKAMGKGALILVADDDQNLCANIEDNLSDKGYQVCVAYDGNAAVNAARSNNFDIMLLDLKLPMLNGMETYLAIRDFRPDVVAIIITGYSKEMHDMIDQTLQKSAYTCLEKPLDMRELVALLEQIEDQKTRGSLHKPKR